jgi:N,N'-diacetyllegionaminate synthase
VGASSLDEIQQAVEWIRSVSSDTEIWLMYGYQSFPTPVDGIHLDYMMKLAELFELPIGYQDHSDADFDAAYWLPAAAAGMGVRILEKHITHDRSLKGIDHESALNPDEFGKFVRMVREIEIAKGKSVPRQFSDQEQKYRKYSKKSLVAAADLHAGKILGRGDFLFMRAERLGFPPDRVNWLIGKRMKHAVPQFHCFSEEDFS